MLRALGGCQFFCIGMGCYRASCLGLCFVFDSSCLFGDFCALRRCRVVRPAAQILSSDSSEESIQRRDDPADCVPFALLRGNLWCAGVGCTAELAARYAFRSNSRRKSVHEAVALYGATATPRPVLLGAFRRVGANADSFSMILIAAHAYGTCAKHHFHQNQPAHAGRSSPTLLSTPGAHSGQRIRARVCLSAASLRETPLNASTTGCPKGRG